MSKGEKSNTGVFDIDRIRQIVQLMEQHELGEVDLQQGDEKIKLCRGVAPAAVPVAAPAPVAAAPAAAPADASADTSGTITINAPMVGTFYSRPNPESEAFVKVGTVVSPDTVCCIVEAMKVFNEIPAECSGKIVEVLAQDQQAVDFGKPLFRVQPLDG
ncbi:acetyl-CoA carboxylase biotin carboxyl carrier protein [Crateriforma conspicua]|uniref:Biotin carboxyl carrier protein of acetyl-CoA carboxylase n=1 Tax=Crateriforma conspicua TaxID=2527996 RepID=A0A5C5Y5E1_9PLAN|nr:acetyl-CoA carboxylase biotin carboxyl carrier protein [Crateriforma conspicua]TWT69933.1 Acetyl-CoA biotin carboxyl carrier [Crateriforma conspicua]